ALGALPPNTGSVWQLSLLTHTTYPRLDLGTGASNQLGGHNVLTASGDGSGIIIADATTNKNANLRFYDPIGDTFPIFPSGQVANFRGAVAAAADGSYFVVDNAVFNSALGLQGSVAPPAFGPNATALTNSLGVALGNNIIVRAQALSATPPTPNSVAN